MAARFMSSGIIGRVRCVKLKRWMKDEVGITKKCVAHTTMVVILISTDSLMYHSAK